MIAKNCDKVHDVHIHFPVQCDEPYAQLVTEIRLSELDGGTLIINTEEEAEIFWYNSDRISDGEFGFVPALAFVLDIHSRESLMEFEKLNSKGWKYSVKVHPRITDITIDDLRKYQNDSKK